MLFGRVLLLRCWVTVKVLLALLGRIIGVLTIRVACSPSFYVDPVVSSVHSLGCGGLAMEAHLVAADILSSFKVFLLLFNWPLMSLFIVFSYLLLGLYLICGLPFGLFSLVLVFLFNGSNLV